MCKYFLINVSIEDLQTFSDHNNEIETMLRLN